MSNLDWKLMIAGSTTILVAPLRGIQAQLSWAEEWLWQGRHLGSGGRAGWASDIILKLKLYTVVWAGQV